MNLRDLGLRHAERQGSNKHYFVCCVSVFIYFKEFFFISA